MIEAYKTLRYKGHTIKIIADDCPESPREWDNLGTMICFHSRYDLGDSKESKHYNDSEDFFAELAGVDYHEFYNKYDKGFAIPGSSKDVYKEVMNKLSKLAHERNIILPIYLYDHSGITMSTGRFSCPWDSGQVGWIYVSKEDVRKEYKWKNLTKERIATIEKYLEGEVETYDQFLTGEVYGWKVVETGESVWGYYGDEGIEDAISEAKSSIDWEVKNSIKKHTEQLKNWIRNKVPVAYRKPLELVV